MSLRERRRPRCIVDTTEASGELTPSLKVKRKIVVERYQSVIDGLYVGREE